MIFKAQQMICCIKFLSEGQTANGDKSNQVETKR